MSALKYLVKFSCPIKMLPKVGDNGIFLSHLKKNGTKIVPGKTEQNRFGSILFPCPWNNLFAALNVFCCIVEKKRSPTEAQPFYCMRSQWSHVALPAHANSYSVRLALVTTDPLKTLKMIENYVTHK